MTYYFHYHRTVLGRTKIKEEMLKAKTEKEAVEEAKERWKGLRKEYPDPSFEFSHPFLVLVKALQL